MMKKHFLLLFLSVFCCAAQAQEADSTEFIFFDKLSSNTGGEGKIRVFQDERLASAMSQKSVSNKKIAEQSGDLKDYVLMSGYRVQVYSSNTARTAKTEAFDMEAVVKEKFDYVDTYITFTSPFWKVRVGDFRTQAEATSMLTLLKKEFPEVKNEFYVVKDNIRVPIR
ncbi:MAG: SPOR domain-containing protein [Prevotellaceae bacterium]|jgi:hypothetical protein|nr:SPOR domain-containing protein [Prevotellaceae bacterium]